MRKRTSLIAGTSLLAALLVSAAAVAADAKKEETGKDIAYNRSKGNCLACHAMPSMPDAEQPGNIGPPLIAMSARYPDKEAMRAKIYDATVSNPMSVMPPVGKHGVLTEEELNKLVDFIYGL
jgi:L-cysteine S-thiosulfotransferase